MTKCGGGEEVVIDPGKKLTAADTIMTHTMIKRYCRLVFVRCQTHECKDMERIIILMVGCNQSGIFDT
jgi:hypothetical protein